MCGVFYSTPTRSPHNRSPTVADSRGEPGGVHDQSVAFPVANRMSPTGGNVNIAGLWVCASVGVNDSPTSVLFANDCFVPRLGDIERTGRSHGHRQITYRAIRRVRSGVDDVSSFERSLGRYIFLDNVRLQLWLRNIFVKRR